MREMTEQVKEQQARQNLIEQIQQMDAHLHHADTARRAELAARKRRQAKGGRYTPPAPR